MRLPGQQVARLRLALLQAFTPDDLRIMVREELDETLENITAIPNHRTVVFELISWAERSGRVAELIEGAHRANPGDAEIAVLAKDIRSYVAPAKSQAVQQTRGREVVEEAPYIPQSRNCEQLAITWILIPAGMFLMGSDRSKDKEALDDEPRLHSRYVGKFCISKYPITNAQYLQFVRARHYTVPPHFKDNQVPKGEEMHPVTQVSLLDAREFCRWAGVRLPTEEEWEKAARGEQGNIWPWGDEPPNARLCNFNDQVKGTTPVTKHESGVSPYGVADMAGNVWEWTDTLYIANLDDVALTSVDDEDTLADEMADRDLVEMAAEDMQPRDEFDKRIVDGLNHPRRSIDPDHSLPIRDETLPHVLRGGSWGDQRTRVRCAARHFDSPSIADWLYGFRVVVSCPEG